MNLYICLLVRVSSKLRAVYHYDYISEPVRSKKGLVKLPTSLLSKDGHLFPVANSTMLFFIIQEPCRDLKWEDNSEICNAIGYY